MSLVETPECNFNLLAPEFSLKNIDGSMWDLDKSKDTNGLLIMFICNHCPYVQAIRERLVEDIRELQNNKIGCVAIMSNDMASYSEDNFSNMQKTAKEYNFSFPYLLDETQKVAKSYGAVCTPDFFGYNSNLELQYRGRFDSAGIDLPKSDNVKELLEAMLLVAKTKQGPKEQYPSMGCSIKWK